MATLEWEIQWRYRDGSRWQMWANCGWDQQDENATLHTLEKERKHVPENIVLRAAMVPADVVLRQLVHEREDGWVVAYYRDDEVEAVGGPCWCTTVTEAPLAQGAFNWAHDLQDLDARVFVDFCEAAAAAESTTLYRTLRHQRALGGAKQGMVG